MPGEKVAKEPKAGPQRRLWLPLLLQGILGVGTCYGLNGFFSQLNSYIGVSLE